MIAEAAQAFRQIRPVGGDHAAFPGCQMLHRVKAEHRHVRHAAGAPSVVFRAQSVTGIFNHGEPVTLGQGENRIEIRRVSSIVDRQNRARAAS